jgi:ELWxxDGT repeat protein
VSALAITALAAPTATLVKDIKPIGGSNPNGFTNFAGKLFFAADDGTHGAGPWTSDGTAAGTKLVDDINPGSGDSSPGALGFSNVAGTLYFGPDDGTHGREPWKAVP